MAKKKFDLGNINLNQSKKEKAKVTEEAIAKIHGKSKAVAESSTPEYVEKKKMGRPRREEAVTRLTVDLPKQVHKKLKMTAMENETSLRQLVIDILMQSVGK